RGPGPSRCAAAGGRDPSPVDGQEPGPALPDPSGTGSSLDAVCGAKRLDGAGSWGGPRFVVRQRGRVGHRRRVAPPPPGHSAVLRQRHAILAFSTGVPPRQKTPAASGHPGGGWARRPHGRVDHLLPAPPLTPGEISNLKPQITNPKQKPAIWDL